MIWRAREKPAISLSAQARHGAHALSYLQLDRSGRNRLIVQRPPQPSRALWVRDERAEGDGGRIAALSIA
jgi:hypothetical protein